MAPLASPATPPTGGCTQGAVDLWRVALHGGPAGVDPLDDELARVERMRDGTGRAHFLASRAWLRVILGRYVGLDPSEVGFALTARGKPSLVGGGPCFSLSRSAGVALIAVTHGPSVGVDVERVLDHVDHDRLAAHFFSTDEGDALQALPEPDRRDEFYRLWVRKEAVVKASGAGLGDGLSHLDVRASIVAGRWSVASLDIGAGLAAAVAVDGAMGPCTFRTPPIRGAGQASEAELEEVVADDDLAAEG